MRRFVLAALFVLFALPFGASISGCSKSTPVTYCNGSDYGPVVGQVYRLDLEPRLTGISINQGAIGSINGPTETDCHGDAASGGTVVYASSNRTLIDVNPATGANGLCAGTWNRNSGAGIADFTICTPNGNQGVAQITATAQGVASNPVNVYVHPVVTSIVLGTASTDCTADPASNCFNPNTLLCDGLTHTTGLPYSGNECVSQGQAAQLAARVYGGTGAAQTNISCLAGPLSFGAQNGSVVTITTDGVATATQPGSTIITVSNSQSSSTAGVFATCPPKSIVLSPFGSTTAPTTPVSVSQNVTEPLVATVTDTRGNPLTNISLTYLSTTPVTIPTSGNNITPAFPGSGTIAAICQPPTCNYAPDNLIGLFGNGEPVLSNPVQITAGGTNNATSLYVASTNSQYLLPVNTNVSTQSSAIRLPYAPNSMVLSEDGTTLYLGTANELIEVATGTNSISRQDISVSGTVLSVSPNNATAVITDPVRHLVYLYASGGVTSQYGGVGERAIWSPDSSTVYIPTTDGQLLVHSAFTGWTSTALTQPADDIALTVPQAGVYLASNPVEIYTNCPSFTVNGNTSTPGTTSTEYPFYGLVAGASASNIAPTNDGLHMLSANYTASTSASGTATGTFQDIGVTPVTTPPNTGSCPFVFSSVPKTPLALTGVTLTPETATNGTVTNFNTDPITSILPTTDSAFAFVTYVGTGGVVPQYNPATGALTNVALAKNASGTPTAPVAGVISSDNNTFYVGTSGDNVVHVLTRGASGFTDNGSPIVPALPSFSGGGSALPNLLAQHPIKSTS